MWDHVAHVAGLVTQYPALTLLIAFLAAVIEAVAVLGMLLPGTPVLMAVAGAAAIAGMPVLPILCVAILGAVIGDGISFWLGCRYRGHLRGAWPFASRPWLMERAEGFFRRYGSMSVALCRFVPVLRSTVPLIAGMAGMRRRRFLIANVLSALVWAPAHVLPAKFAGLSMLQIRDGDWTGAAVCAGVVLLFAAGGFWVHRVLRSRTRPG